MKIIMKTKESSATRIKTKIFSIKNYGKQIAQFTIITRKKTMKDFHKREDKSVFSSICL